ncbi:MAG: RidA family protein [Gemmatimonadales bacterium]|nr:RidA family protein [Gemmatimonadales bacterium]
MPSRDADADIVRLHPKRTRAGWHGTRLVLAATLLAGCEGAGARPPEPSFIPVGGNTALPFSAAVRVGDMLYLAGQLGTDSTGKLVSGGIGPETRQAMENIRAVVERNGSSMDRVVKCLVMLADMGEWGAMNAVYVAFFPTAFPARSAMGANGLALGARVEIECLAVASGRE